MAEWRKILVSGSNAHVSSITASAMGTVSEDTEVVFRHAIPGTFHVSGSDFNIKYTSSDSGQLYLDNIGLRAHNISASGVPNSVTDNSQVLFWHPTHGGLKATSSLYFDTDDNELEFIDGLFSGSFQGDGSQLTGVVGTLPNFLTNANGIVSSSGENFEYDGTEAVTVQVETASNSGLAFITDGLSLDPNLAGEGLYFPSASDSNYSTMSVDLAPNSGLNTGSSGLKLNDTLPGDGLEYSTANSVMRVKLAANSGLYRDNSGIRLSAGLPGFGLEYATNYNVLQVKESEIVTNNDFVIFGTGSSNLTLTGGSMTTASSNGFQAYLIDDPEFTYDLNSTLTGNFNFVNDLIVQGDFTVSGSLITASIETENLNIADQFILLNSGSTTGDGGFVVQAGAGVGAYLFYDSESARWGVSDAGESLTQNAHSITSSDHAAIVTTTITGDSEATILGSTPLFGTDDNSKQGQFVITTAPAENESSIYIYS